MVHAGHNAGTAAAAVGYESASQFGREFKRMFGASPVEETAAIRARLAAGRLLRREIDGFRTQFPAEKQTCYITQYHAESAFDE